MRLRDKTGSLMGSVCGLDMTSVSALAVAVLCFIGPNAEIGNDRACIVNGIGTRRIRAWSTATAHVLLDGCVCV